MNERDIERFWSKVDKRGPGECWTWKAGTDKDGYGFFALEGRKERSHRVSFFIQHGKWPEPFGCHTCDNPPCVNPAHLFEGCIAANNSDRKKKGRYETGDRHWTRKKPECLARGPRNGKNTSPDRTRRGSRHPRALLTESSALQIPDLVKAGLTRQQIADMFGVSKNAVRNVLTGHTWSHVFKPRDPAAV